MKIWLGTHRDGALRAEAEALVPVFDHGLTVGDGVFETLKAEGGVVFAVTRHLDRLARSAHGLGLPAPDLDVVREAIAETVAANDTDGLARVRVTYTGGASPLGSERGHSDPTLVIAVAAAQPAAETTSVITVPWTRNENSAIAGLKTTSYAENVVALARAKAAGSSEALLADTQGRLSEGTGTNVFVVIDGQIKTPALTSGCLAGITRALVLHWLTIATSGASVASAGLSAPQETDLPFHDALYAADEVFLTSSLRDVQAVTEIDGRKVGDGVIGPVTAAVRDLFRRQAADDPDPR